MGSADKEAILQILSDRQLPIEFDLEKICFPEQLAFIRDPASWVTASCSRRAGKTEVCALDLTATAIQNAGVNCLYITLSRANAEKLVWAKLLEINERYKLGGSVNVSKLSITFPNQSVIYLSGCKDKSELNKFRGLALKLVYIDEVQSFKDFIRELIDDVLGPALLDYDGSLKLIGTPRPICAGFFWDAIQSDAYSHHHWTFWDNPHIALKSKKTHQELFEKTLKRRGVTASHSSIQREYFGKWTNDSEGLVFQYSKSTNDFDLLPILTDFVIGVDLGSNRKDRDKDAIAVIGWHQNQKEAYLVEEFIGQSEGITPLTDKLAILIARYSPLKVVMDTGGLGLKIADELRKRNSLPIVAAEKTRKIEFIALLNDAMRSKRFMARKASRFAEDCSLVEYDYDKCTADKSVIKSEPHSDIADAVLYAFRESLAWLSEPIVEPVNPRCREAWIAHVQKRLEEQLELQIQREQAQEATADSFAMMDADIFDTNPLSHYLNKKRGG